MYFRLRGALLQALRVDRPHRPEIQLGQLVGEQLLSLRVSPITVILRGASYYSLLFMALPSIYHL